MTGNDLADAKANPMTDPALITRLSNLIDGNEPDDWVIPIAKADLKTLLDGYEQALLHDVILPPIEPTELSAAAKWASPYND